MKKIIYLLILLFSIILKAQTFERNLSNERWDFSELGKNEFLKANVPGTIHTDLFQNKKIPDPFYSNNEKKMQWIEEKDWIYKMNFILSYKEFNNSNIDLILNGIDTFADVQLNGQNILSANNMFRTWNIDTKKYLKIGKNELQIVFKSSSKKGKDLAKNLSYELPENERIFVRKAQYHFGWDWGPRFVTAGIWKPIVLKFWNAAEIKNIKQNQILGENSAKINFKVDINAENSGDYFLIINEISKKYNLTKGLNSIDFKYEIKNPKLWWCNGLGEPNLYDFKISLNKNQAKIDEKSLKIGLRKIELIQDRDEIGKSFYFKLNGIPVYAKGSNVIPTHSFLPSAEKNMYKKWMKEAKFANMNMLRVWGGGIYADDDFYDEADKNGILIWQDFMFACGMYPGDKDFLENVKNEVIDQTNRLQNHASLAIWCGNNESDEGWNNWGWQKQFNYSKKDSAKIWGDYVKLFREIIPQTLDSVSAQKSIYWQSSPKNGWGRKLSYEEGDVHYWGVWWGLEPLEKYKEKTGRFLSEYGFQGMPPISTFLKFTDKSQLYLTKKSDSIQFSEDVNAHQKNVNGFEKIIEYMKRDYKMPTNFEDFAYVSQLLQARAMEVAVESHRQKKPYNMGTLYWQFNDVWPVISWSSLDFYGNRKASHYQFKKSFEPFFLSVEETENSYKIWVNNDFNEDFKNKIFVELIDFKGNILYQNEISGKTEKLSNNVVVEIQKKNFEKFDLTKSVLKIASKSENRTTFALHYFSKPKDLVLEKPLIQITYINEKTMEISSNTLAKNVYLVSENEGNFDDNFFDLLAHEKKIISAEFPIKNLKIKTLFDVK